MSGYPGLRYRPGDADRKVPAVTETTRNEIRIHYGRILPDIKFDLFTGGIGNTVPRKVGDGRSGGNIDSDCIAVAHSAVRCFHGNRTRTGSCRRKPQIGQRRIDIGDTAGNLDGIGATPVMLALPVVVNVPCPLGTEIVVVTVALSTSSTEMPVIAFASPTTAVCAPVRY